MADAAGLQNLHDIIEPATVGFWPPAQGVWLVLALMLLWVGVGLVFWGFRRRQNAYRRAGVQELRNIRLRLDMPDGKIPAVQQLAVLLKRVALTGFPREKVAALSGDSWLAFLDATMDGGKFTSAPGNLLTAITYRPSDFPQDGSDRQVDELFNLADRWIRQHRSAMPIEHPAFKVE